MERNLPKVFPRVRSEIEVIEVTSLTKAKEGTPSEEEEVVTEATASSLLAE